MEAHTFLKKGVQKQRKRKSMKDIIASGIKKAFKELHENDRYIFGYHTDEECSDETRKLHEVCINHHLANYLEKYLLQEVEISKNESIYFDIEFNREGQNPKYVNKKIYRPDIIVHNRKSDSEKLNILIVECKKEGSIKSKIIEDMDKIEKFMTDKTYQYQFGLHVIYGDIIKGLFFFKEEDCNDKIFHLKINYPENI
jgi:uncharacterized protein YpiB (UPF0302 family)